MTATVTAAPRLQRRNYGRGHGYKIDGQKVVGVTTAIGALDKPALRNWYAEQAADRAVNEWDRLSELPVVERHRYIMKGPKDTVRAASIRGTEIHTLGQGLANGEDVDVPPEHVGPVEAYARWLDRWQITTLAAETPVGHTRHGYGGTADLWGRVGVRGDALALLDVKTGKGVWSETGLQLAAYRFSEVMQPEPGIEIATPEVEFVYVAHVLPDDVRTLPVEAGADTFRDFLYVLQAYRAWSGWRDEPLIGEAERP